VVCARIVMRADAGDDGIDITPRHDRVDEAVAAATGEVVVAEAQTAEVVT